MTRTMTVGLVALWAVGALADDKMVPLDVKVGQWEMTHTTVMKGVPPIPAEMLAKMSPEVRARYEAMSPTNPTPPPALPPPGLWAPSTSAPTRPAT